MDLHSSLSDLDPGGSRLARQYDVNFARDDPFQLRVVYPLLLMSASTEQYKGKKLVSTVSIYRLKQ